MSLRSKMLAMSTIPLIVLVFAVTYAVSAQRTASRTNEDVDRTTGVRRELAEIQNDLAIAESSVRGFVLTGQARMREDYDEAVVELHGDLDDLKARVTEPLQRNRLEPLEALVDERLATLARGPPHRTRSIAGGTGPIGDVLPPRADHHRARSEA